MSDNEEPTLSFSYDFDERAAWDIEAKGWARAVVRLPGGRRVAVNFYDPVVVAQELERDEVCVGEPGMIVVPSVTLENMNRAVHQLYGEGYFDSLADLLRVPCPCCGHLTLGAYPTNPAGYCDVCPVCFWVRNSLQSANPELEGGGNRISLTAARANYREFGASEKMFLGNVRPPRPEEMPPCETGSDV